MPGPLTVSVSFGAGGGFVGVGDGLAAAAVPLRPRSTVATAAATAARRVMRLARGVTGNSSRGVERGPTAPVRSGRIGSMLMTAIEHQFSTSQGYAVLSHSGDRTYTRLQGADRTPSCGA